MGSRYRATEEREEQPSVKDSQLMEFEDIGE